MSFTAQQAGLGKSGTEGDWIPLMEYAMKKGVSLSTLRRHIKAGKIHHRVEGGRYLLLAMDEAASAAPPAREAGASRNAGELEQALRRAQEEIAELKTLLAFYEEKMASARMDC